MDPIAPFTGFTAASITFLCELKVNNNREWFNERKQIYQESLLQPFRALAMMLSPTMYNIDPLFELHPAKMLSRIYRDIRFSPNKEPYKTSMWLNFQRKATHWEDYPGFFAELSSDQFTYGMGLYSPRRKIMDTLREEISFSRESFREMALQAAAAGFTVEGEPYKRALPSDLPEFYQPWIQRKSCYLVKRISPTDPRLCSSAIALQLMEDFTQAADLYHFMMDIVKETDQ